MFSWITKLFKSRQVINRIYRVVRVPAADRTHWHRQGGTSSDKRLPQVGDYGWDNSPESGLIHLTGYDEKFCSVWYADFEQTEVEYVGPKPDALVEPNPYPVLNNSSQNESGGAVSDASA